MKTTIDTKILVAGIIYSLGIRAHKIGFQHLQNAISMGLENPELLTSLSTKLYPEIIEKDNTASVDSVRSSIKESINEAWKNSDPEAYNSFFENDTKPTPKIFITTIVDVLRRQFEDENESTIDIDMMLQLGNEIKTNPKAPPPIRKEIIENVEKTDIQKLVADTLYNLGAPTDENGYNYLQDAFIMCLEDSELLNAITKKLFLKVAEKYHYATPVTVRAAIGQVIDVVWKECDPKILNQFFENYIANNGQKKPPYLMFIATIAGHLRLQLINESKKGVIGSEETANIDIEILAIDAIHKVGISERRNGSQYIREAIVMCVKDSELLNSLSTNLYPIIAEKYNTTAIRVHNGISTALSVNWKEGDTETHKRLFGYNILSETKRPTTKKFIAAIAENVWLQLGDEIKKELNFTPPTKTDENSMDECTCEYKFAERIYCQVFGGESSNGDMYVGGILEALGTLGAREEKVLEYLYRDGCTFREVGEKFNITANRIRQIETKALRKLRHPSRLGEVSVSNIIEKKDRIIEDRENIIQRQNDSINNLSAQIESFLQGNPIDQEAYKTAMTQNLSIEEMGLSVRAYNCLKRVGVNFIEDLLLRFESENDLMKVRNLGRKQIEEIILKMYKLGFTEWAYKIDADEETPNLTKNLAQVSPTNSDIQLSPEIQKILRERTIEAMSLETRVYTCLKRAGIHESKDLLEYNVSQLMKIPNLGKKSVIEIIEKMRGMGYTEWTNNMKTEISGQTDIKELDLSVSIYNWLKENRVNCVEDFILDFGRIATRMRLDNLGKDSMYGIINKMRECGYTEWADKLEEKQKQSIEDLDLSLRAYNALKRAGINTAENLLEYNLDKLKSIRNLGETSRKEVIAKMRERGYSVWADDMELKYRPRNQTSSESPTAEESPTIEDESIAPETSATLESPIAEESPTIEENPIIAIEDMEFDTRIYKHLKKHGIKTTECLLELDNPDEVLKIGVFKKPITEVFEKMRKYGFTEWADKTENKIFAKP